MNEFTPDYVSPPGETLMDIIEENSLVLSRVADSLGLTSSELLDLVHGTLIIDEAIAIKLSSVVSTTEFWLEREAQYRASLFT